MWVHRAIVVFKELNQDSKIVYHRDIESAGHGGAKKKSNTLLDIIVALIRFNRENRQFFTFILKNLHSGNNKINWAKTIATATAIVQGKAPAYLDPVNKKRQVNFDEELIVIYYSILYHIAQTYGFKVDIGFGFKLITGAKFQRYLNGLGRVRLRQIKYKYFSDTAVRLWNLCYAFFDKAYKVNVSADKREYLLVHNFNIVFESIIDELIGDKNLPRGLKEQDDGKIVDHFYTYEGLILKHEPDEADKEMYYIGDSKYYKFGNRLSDESVYKQYTYARNVIQWNLNLFLDPGKRADEDSRYRDIRLRDDVTEGYNVIPNFFISAQIPQGLRYEDDGITTTNRKVTTHVSRQYINRLFDRDTLLLTHYDVNFLYVLSLYARNNHAQKAAWRDKVREIFRQQIQAELSRRFNFHALRANPGLDTDRWFKDHFKDIIGKVFSPYENDPELIALALADPSQIDNAAERQAVEDENARVLALIDTAFERKPLGNLNTDARVKLPPHLATAVAGTINGNFLFGIVNKTKKVPDGRPNITKEYMTFANHEATSFSMKNMPSGDIFSAKHFLPMYDGGIEGFYEITSIKFGTRKTEVTDANGNDVVVNMPCLNIALGTYHSLGDHIASVPGYPNWNGQIHTYQEVLNLYNTTATQR